MSLEFSHAAGIVLDHHYQRERFVKTWPPPPLLPNIHEFKIIEDGHSVLYMYSDGDYGSSRSGITGHVTFEGFIEQDLDSGNITFQWTSRDHVSINESYMDAPVNWGQDGVYWDYM